MATRPTISATTTNANRPKISAVGTQPALNTINPSTQLFSSGSSLGGGGGGGGSLVAKTTPTVGGTLGNIGRLIAKGFLKSAENIVDLPLGVYGALANDKGIQNYVKRDLTKETEQSLFGNFTATKGQKNIQNLEAKSATKESGIGGQIAQGIGQVGGMIGTAGLIPAKGIPFKAGKISGSIPVSPIVTGAGGGIETALQEGKKGLGAVGYAAGKGLIEGGTEAITGGIKIPGNKGALDDIVTKAIGTKFAGNKPVKAIAKLLYNTIGEGAEEVLAGLGDMGLRKIANMKQVDQQLLASFIVGGALGGILGVGNLNVNDVINQEIDNIKQGNPTSKPINETQSQVKQQYGTTNDYNKAGFILNDTSLLNLDDGKGSTIDHSEVANMNELIKDGAIRIGIKPDTGVLETQVKPSTEQSYKIAEYANEVAKQNKDFTIELIDGENRTSFTYKNENINTDKIRNDINNFYDKGITPSSIRQPGERPVIASSKQLEQNTIAETKAKENVIKGKDVEQEIGEDMQGDDVLVADIKKASSKIGNVQAINVAPTLNNPKFTSITENLPDPTNIRERIVNIKQGDMVKNLLKDFKDQRGYQTNDVYRNFENSFSKEAFKEVKKNVLEPFDQSKLDYVTFLKDNAFDLKSNIDKWGIKKGSKDSALIQKYGEKIITLEQLKQQTKNWENAVEADKYFRKKYDEFIDKINRSRQVVYPNVEENIKKANQDVKEITQKIKDKRAELNSKDNTDTKLYDNLLQQIDNLETRLERKQELLQSEELFRGKRIPKRTDYYRHFQELSGAFNTIHDLVTTPADIPSKLAGVSEFTKPNTKFLSLAQQRKGTKTKYDAVGGFLDYLTPASYAINIDPQIKVFRDLARQMAVETKDNPTANKFIEYLGDYANNLAGKQSTLDRGFQKLIGPKAFKVIDYLGGRIKANAILMNFSSSISQVLNLPQGIADVSNPKHLIKGLSETIKQGFSKNKIYDKSPFMSERFTDIENQFDTKLIEQPKKFAKWLVTVLDEKATKFIWNSEYAKAKAEKMPNPIDYADNRTRKMVAGRGIGEQTLAQESKVVKLMLPFTVEVGNNMRTLYGKGGFIRDKKFGKYLVYAIMAWLFNQGIKKVGGGGSTHDPIQAIIEASGEDLTPIQRGSRLMGEILSSTPSGQVLASLYPEYGGTSKVGDKEIKFPTRKDLFGETDPTRFGTGNIFTKAFSSPEKIVTSFVTPFGGSQLSKTKKGLEGLANNASISASGKYQYPIDIDTGNILRAILFGNFKETQGYYDKNSSPLSENQAAIVSQSSNSKETYDSIINARKYKSLQREYQDLLEAGKDTTNIERKINTLFE